MVPQGGDGHISNEAIMRELDQLHRSMDGLTKKLDDVVSMRLGKIEVQIATIKPENYVTQEQFKPMSRLFWFIVFSFAGIVVSAVGSLVIQQNKPISLPTAPASQGVSK